MGGICISGNKHKPRDINKIEVLDGNLELTKKIYEADTGIKERYTRIVLSFKGKEDKEKIKKVYEDFKKNFMHGYDSDEYNIAAIAHYDTDNYHIHVCLPKLNLRTKKHNNYYFDKIDRYRVNLIRDYLNIKYSLNIQEEKELIKEDKTINRLEKWREEHKQPKISLKRKRGRDKATKDIKDYLIDLIQTGMVDSLDKTKEVLESLGVKVVKEGWDSVDGEKIFYLTIQDNQNNKLKLKGELFNADFYKSIRQNCKTEGRNIRRIEKPKRRNNRNITEIQARLAEANRRRKDYISQKIRRNEKRRRMEHMVGNIKSDILDDNIINNNCRNNDRNNENNNTNRKTTNGINLQDNSSNTKRGINANTNRRNEQMEKGSKDSTVKRKTGIGRIIKQNQEEIFESGTRLQNNSGRSIGIRNRIRNIIKKISEVAEEIINQKKKELKLKQKQRKRHFMPHR